MRRICTIIILLAMFCMLAAAPVDVQLAINTASAWLANASGETPGLANAQAWPANETHHLWIVSFADGGFVILPGDDCATPILAWDAQAEAPLTDMHPGFENMLDGYVRQLEAIADAGLGNEQTRPLWEAIANDIFTHWPPTRDVAPLISTSWDQDWPYNGDCPSDNAGPGGHAYAGCGATTMAQIMKFWAHPATGQSQHSYYHPDYGTISADFSATDYNWSGMPNVIYSYDGDVAELLFHCGVAQDMDYGPDGSGAQSSDVVNAFPNYFDYDDDLQRVQKNNYSSVVWQQMMRDELDNGRPVFYAGYGASFGHAFVLDGYQGTSQFHFNFGWSGYYNGYYSFSNINPGPYVFNDDQEAIIGIQPDTGGNDGDPPTNLTAVVQNGNDAHLHWSMPLTTEELRWDSGQNNGNSIGLNGTGGVFIVAARFTTTELADFDGMSLTDIEIFANDEAPLELKVWTGGSWSGAHGNDGTEIVSQPLTGVNWDSFNTIALNSPVTIDASEELWIGYEIDDPGAGVHPVGCDEGPSVNYFGNLIYTGQWSSLYDVAPDYNYNWNLGGYVTGRDGERIPLTHRPNAKPVCRNDNFSESGVTGDPVSVSPCASRDLTGFKVYRNDALIGTVDNGTGRDWDDANLADGSYDYYVTAMYGALESTPSNTASVVINADEYPAPENLTYQTNNNDVHLSWYPPGGAGVTEELVYDHDNGVVGYQFDGNSMGVHMSPQGPCQILTLKYHTSIIQNDHDFNAEVWNWENSAPGVNRLYLQPAVAIENSWMEVDISDANIEVDGDFMAAFGSVNSTAFLAVDNTFNNGRSFDYTTSTNSWSYWNETYHIRAIVLYPDGSTQELRPADDDTKSLPRMAHISKHGFDRGRFIEAANSRVEPLFRPAIDHYTIYRDDTIIDTVLDPITTYNDIEVTDGYHVYFVTASYSDGVESSASNFITVPVNDIDDNDVPGAVTGLQGNYPNPFNPTTTVRFSLCESETAELSVYNMRGQKVTTLLRESLPAGEHEVVWRGVDDAGAPVASGIYFCRLQAGSFVETRKMILLK